MFPPLPCFRTFTGPSLLEIDFCTNCQQSDTMIKLLTKPTYIKNNNSNNNRVGVLTKEYIEANKELLEAEKLKAKSETYDPT